MRRRKKEGEGRMKISCSLSNEEWPRLNSFRAALTQKYGRSPTPEEIAMEFRRFAFAAIDAYIAEHQPEGEHHAIRIDRYRSN